MVLVQRRMEEYYEAGCSDVWPTGWGERPRSVLLRSRHRFQGGTGASEVVLADSIVARGPKPWSTSSYLRLTSF